MKLIDFITLGIGLGITASCWGYRYKVISPTWWRMERSDFQEWIDCGIAMAFLWPIPWGLAIWLGIAIK